VINCYDLTATVEDFKADFRPIDFQDGFEEDRQMKKLHIIGQIVCAVITLTSVTANACTRFIYETGSKTFVVGRSMDWMEDPKTDLWAFPQGRSVMAAWGRVL
jgi:hypothetical protein